MTCGFFCRSGFVTEVKQSAMHVFISVLEADTRGMSQALECLMQITINRPQKRNAFRPQTTEEMMRCFSDARDDPDIGVVILTGMIYWRVFYELHLTQTLIAICNSGVPGHFLELLTSWRKVGDDRRCID